MIQSKDYKNYITGNKELLELFEQNNSILYYHLKDVIYVCNYISNFFKKNKESDETEDLEVIFETGFKYLHEQLEQIKIYYDKFFNKDYFLFKRYELLVSYTLYIDDISESLAEKEYLTAHRKNILSTLAKDIDKMIVEKTTWNDNDIDKFNEIINSCLPNNVEILTTEDIFASIAEEIEIIG